MIFTETGCRYFDSPWSGSASGQGYDYNNTNYVLLGMIIEKITGNTVGAEIKKRIIDKLGLRNTSFPTTEEMPVPFMHGYMPYAIISGDTSGPKIPEVREDPETLWSG